MTSHRTLSDACAIRDSSNRTLKFPRDMRSAGILGPLAPVETDTLGGWARAVAAAVAVGLLVYGMLVAVFSI